MFLVRLVIDTIESERKVAVVYFCNTALLVLVLNLMIEEVDILYPVGLSLFLFCIYLAIRAHQLYNFREMLASAKSGVISEYKSSDMFEQGVVQTINFMHTDYLQRLHSLNIKSQQRNNLFSGWIHNMKTSLAVIELAGEANKPDALDDIAVENEKLKANLEQCLNILRLDKFENDYVPERVSLMEVVNTAINNKKRDLIYSGLFPKAAIDEQLFVYTDKKWCVYVIEQLISNAIKYSEHMANKHISFSTEQEGNQITLKIADEGVGIDSEDLSRVFELFFTGKNGRSQKNATGIGLYMVEYIVGKLGHKIEMRSTVGVGTTVEISFLSKL